jgi:hypothetical protein
VPLVTETVPPLLIEVEFKFKSAPLVLTEVKSKTVVPPDVATRAQPAVPVATAVPDVTVPKVKTPDETVPSAPEIVSVTSNVPVAVLSALVGLEPV